MIIFFSAILGLIVGSFLNVVILRHGVRGLGGRSACPNCSHALAAYDLIPVFSWISLGGACRYCRSSISAQYPLVEATTAISFAALFFIAQDPYTIACGIVMLALLVCITVYDIKHTIIPNLWVYSFALMALIYHAPQIVKSGALPMLLVGALAAMAPLFILWLISGGRWMGLGDVKLAAGIGLLLGWPDGLTAVMSSFILGTLIMLPLLLLGRLLEAFTHRYPFLASRLRLTMKSEVPFGPFLIASCVIFWLMQLNGMPFTLGWLSAAQ